LEIMSSPLARPLRLAVLLHKYSPNKQAVCNPFPTVVHSIANGRPKIHRR
jgi:hypothetical protein